MRGVQYIVIGAKDEIEIYYNPGSSTCNYMDNSHLIDLPLQILFETNASILFKKPPLLNMMFMIFFKGNYSTILYANVPSESIT